MKTKLEGVLRIVERIVFWLPFGLLLFLAAEITQSIIVNFKFPAPKNIGYYALLGPVLFVVIELFVHTVLAVTKNDSIFNGRG